MKKTDVRYIRTEEVIKNAFIDLVSEKGFYEITVKDITNQANISRGTFYQHYEDKDALLASFEDTIKTDLLDALMPGRIPFTTEAVKSRIVRIFTYCEQNIVVMRALFGRNGSFEFQKRMREMLWENVFAQHVNYEGLAKIVDIPAAYLKEYVNSSHYRVAQIWLEKDTRETPEELAEIFLKLSIISPLNRAKKPAGKKKVTS